MLESPYFDLEDALFDLEDHWFPKGHVCLEECPIWFEVSICLPIFIYNFHVNLDIVQIKLHIFLSEFLNEHDSSEISERLPYRKELQTTDSPSLLGQFLFKENLI